MKIFDAGLKPDTLNANKGTQRGRGLIEKSLRNFGGGRSILADKDNNIIAGNKTLEAAADIDLPVRIIETDGTELVVVKRTDLDLYSDTDLRARQLAYADNKIGELDLEFDKDQIDLDYDRLGLGDWGFDNSEDEKYTKSIEAPIYTPKSEKPHITDLYDETKTNDLLLDIERSELPEEEKYFLRIAARRHTVLNYKRIAEYYAHSEIPTQTLMENSALIIIDFNRALELGYVSLSKSVAEQYGKEND